MIFDFGVIKAFADSASDLHNSDHGARLETFIFVWIIVKRFTKPISSAVQKLVIAHEANAQKLAMHDAKIESHDKRLGVLETDVETLKTKP